MFFNDLFIIFIIIQKPNASIDVHDNNNRTETEVDRVEIITPDEHPRQFISHTPISLVGSTNTTLSGTTSRETLSKVILKIL
ncbi:MAG TPA: hypothetical protein VJ583_07580 [Nitrososphaeraceae archaeon]|nr:hypothetical protein [Nitrososphaeraceae archaeon]